MSTFRFLSLAYLCLALLLSACGNNDTNNSATPPPPTQKEDLGGLWYRHYEGTIAGQLVSVDIYHGNDLIYGFYSYNKQDIPLSFYEQTDSSKNGMYFLYETVITDRNDGVEQAQDHWEISFKGDAISGSWVSRDHTKKHDIQLKETYSTSYRFTLLRHQDSTRILINGTTHGATTSYTLSVPAAGNSDESMEVTNASILKELGCTTGTDIIGCLKTQDASYFKSYVADLDTSDFDEEFAYQLDHESSLSSSVMYNRNGMVVLQFDHYTYSGGAHGMNASSYTCIDVTGKRMWELNDILHVDTVALFTLLEAEARKQFQIPSGEPLESRLISNDISMPDDVSFTSTGLIFHYAPYSIASYADGDVDLYIPFSKLGSMLHPAFRQRMNIP